MVKRKKSLLFSAALVSAGLVAGVLYMTAPKTQASSEELGATATKAEIQQISEEANTSFTTTEESLRTHKLLIKVSDENMLKANKDIVEYKKLADNIYSATFKDYDSTSENYFYYKNGDDSDANLNVPLKINFKSANQQFRIGTIDGGANYSDVKSCTQAQSYKYTNFTGIPDECLGWGVSSMRMQEYAKSITSSKEIKVAIIDTGISANHDAFSYASEGAKDRLDMTLAYDYFDNDNNPDDSGNTTDTYGQRITHGTTVAGVIAESTPSNVKIVPVRVTNGEKLDIDSVLKAIKSLAGKVDIINLSLGAMDDGDYSLADEALKEAKNKGTIIVAATGNNYANGANYVAWPAKSDHTIAVGSIDDKNEISAFSQRGGEVDFTAPGDTILLPTGDDRFDLAQSKGTSFSTPFVSAAIANILSEHPNYSHDDVYSELKLNTEDLGSDGKDNTYGWGGISFHINKFADLDIELSANNEPSGKSATLSLGATSNDYYITDYAVENGDTTKTAPSNWTAISSPAKTATATESVNDNGIYTVWFRNSNNEIAAKTLTVSNIENSPSSIESGNTQGSENGNTQGSENGNTQGSENGNTSTSGETGTNPESGNTGTSAEPGNTGSGTSNTSTETNDTGSEASNTGSGAENTPNPSNNNGQTAENSTASSNANTETKIVKAAATSVKNPQTADINIVAITGASIALGAVAFLLFRTKRR